MKESPANLDFTYMNAFSNLINIKSQTLNGNIHKGQDQLDYNAMLNDADMDQKMYEEIDQFSHTTLESYSSSFNMDIHNEEA